MVVTMKLQQALERKKRLAEQVDRIRVMSLVRIRKAHDEKTSDGVAIETAEKELQASYDKSIALFYNFTRLTSAINDANARIQIEVAGEKMSIATAIMRKRKLDAEEMLWTRILQDYNAVNERVRSINERELSQDKLNAYLETNGATKGQNKPEVTKQYTEQFYCLHEVALYDPLDIKARAEKEMERISRFREEISLALQIANIENEIEVDFDQKSET